MDPYQAVAVVNRRAVKYEGMFNGVCIVFEPHQKKSYPPNVAIALVADSVLKTNAATGIQEVFALGIEGDAAYPTAPLEGSLARTNPVEQLDRRDVHKLTETEPKVLGAGGVEDLGIGKNEKTVTPVPGTEESPIEGEPPVGGAAPGGVPVAPAEEVKAVSFKNDEVRKGTSRPGRAEHRVSTKPQ